MGRERKSARRTSDKQHLALLLDGADGGLAGLVVVVFVGDENGFFDVAEDEVAVRVVGLAGRGVVLAWGFVWCARRCIDRGSVCG
jgi:hypothetical protein